MAAASRSTRGTSAALVKRLGERAGIERRVHPEALRHTFESELSDRGIEPATSNALGHQSLATTRGYITG